MSVKIICTPLEDETERAGEVEPWYFFRSEDKGSKYTSSGSWKGPLNIYAEEGYTPDFSMDGIRPTSSLSSCPDISHDRAYDRLNVQDDKVAIVPCSKSDDEKIILITVLDEWLHKITGISFSGCTEIAVRSDSVNGYPFSHIVVRMDDPRGFVTATVSHKGKFSRKLTYSWDGYTVSK